MATFWVISKRLRARLSTRSMCLDADTQELISEFAMRISLSSMSILSHEIGNESGDDYVISQCFPGGHEGFMETLIRIKLRSSRVLQVKEANDLMSDTYDHLIHDRNNLKLVADIVARYSFKGEILNLGYGAGNIGTLILAVHDANLTGVDISPKTMIHAKHYKKVCVGEMQNIVPLIGNFDHTVSYGAMNFLMMDVFLQALDMCFAQSRQSVNLGLECIPDELNKHLLEISKNYFDTFDHLKDGV